MAEKMDLDALEVRNLGRVIRADDWMALLRYARRMERRVSELERASQPGGGEAGNRFHVAVTVRIGDTGCLNKSAH